MKIYVHLILLMFQKGDYMFTFDLKSAYHHVDIYREHCEYLGFAWGQGPTTKYYVFCVLPFGLATAPYLSTPPCETLERPGHLGLSSIWTTG